MEKVSLNFNENAMLSLIYLAYFAVIPKSDILKEIKNNDKFLKTRILDLNITNVGNIHKFLEGKFLNETDDNTTLKN